MEEKKEKGGGGLLRIGVGIGRPKGGGRESAEVSQFVLGRVGGEEMERLEELVGELVEVLKRNGEAGGGM